MRLNHTALPTRLSILALLLTLGGCAGGITGYDGSSDYSCKAPVGVKCDSISGTYANAIQNNLPSQRRGSSSTQPAPGSAAPATPAPSNLPVMLPTAAGASPQIARAAVAPTGFTAPPLRSAPRVLRLWVKPWEDADRDLNGESFVYVQVDGGRWLVDHAQRQVREQYLPVRPGKPQSAQKGSSPDASKGSPTSSAGDDGSAIAQALRALQGKSQQPDN